jgi:hypothetical protein
MILKMRFAGTVCIVFIVLTAPMFTLVLAQTYSNGGNSVILYPPNSSPFGMSYADWGARWHTWVYAIPSDINPVTDTTGKYCMQNQHSPVWFLAGTAGGAVERTCMVPRGMALFFPMISNECSYAEYPSLKDAAQLRNCAISANNIQHLEFSVDGINIPDAQKYRATTSLFNFTFSDKNIAGVAAGHTQGVADGFFGFISPLSAGNHTIHFSGSSVDVTSTAVSPYAVDTTYHVIVK